LRDGGKQIGIWDRIINAEDAVLSPDEARGLSKPRIHGKNQTVSMDCRISRWHARAATLLISPGMLMTLR
jgi:hypothetical protein